MKAMQCKTKQTNETQQQIILFNTQTFVDMVTYEYSFPMTCKKLINKTLIINFLKTKKKTTFLQTCIFI